MKVTQNMTL